MKLLNRIGLHRFIVFAFLTWAIAFQWARAEDSKPVRLEILLPADAELEVNGYKTKSTGKTRRFESPPVSVGRTYLYELKVFWRGRSLTRKLEVRPENPSTLDLRKELEALQAPKPTGSFTLWTPPDVKLRADEHLVIPLRVKRSDFPEPIRIHFENLPKGISVPEVSLSEEQSESNAMLFAAADTTPGLYPLLIVALSGQAREVSTIKMTIAKAETKIESKPEKAEAKIENKTEKKPATPPQMAVEKKSAPKVEKSIEAKTPAKPKSEPSPELCVLSPNRLVLHPGQTEYVEVKIARTKQEPLSSEPTITLVVPPGSNLTGELWTAYDFKENQGDHTVGFALKTSADSGPREQQVKVIVAVGALKTEQTIPVTILSQEPKIVTKADTSSVPLQLVIPARVEVKSGETFYLEMSVQTSDGSPLPEAPSVMLVSPSDSGVRCEPWASSFQVGESRCMVSVALSADTNAQPGARQVRIRAVAGRGFTESPLQVSVAPRP